MLILVNFCFIIFDNFFSRVVCRHRYHWAKVAQQRQFMKELHSFEKLQPNALDGVRVHREFSQGILSHKIPPRRYIQKLTKDPMTSKERMRVELIISGRVNFSQKQKSRIPDKTNCISSCFLGFLSLLAIRYEISFDVM